MGKRLKSYVHVHQENGETHVYGPQDDVPAEDAELIGDHAWVDDDEPLPDDRVGVVVENSGDGAAQSPRTGPAGGGKSASPRRAGSGSKSPAKAGGGSGDGKSSDGSGSSSSD